MIKIKRIKLDRIELTDLGFEHWVKVYSRYQGRFYRTYQLVISNHELTSPELGYELAKRTREVKQHVQSLCI